MKKRFPTPTSSVSASAKHSSSLRPKPPVFARSLASRLFLPLFTNRDRGVLWVRQINVVGPDSRYAPCTIAYKNCKKPTNVLLEVTSAESTTGMPRRVHFCEPHRQILPSILLPTPRPSEQVKGNHMQEAPPRGYRDGASVFLNRELGATVSDERPQAREHCHGRPGGAGMGSGPPLSARIPATAPPTTRTPPTMYRIVRLLSVSD